MEVDNTGIEKNTETNQQEKFETNFHSKDFNDLSFFRLGQTTRTYWPHDVTSTEFKIPALTLTEWYVI